MSKPKDWKKHMFRLKQIADQNFGRAEKSEVLTENLLLFEKRVELVKDAFTKTQKKMHDGIQTKGLDPDRRMKKHAEYQMGHAMLEAATLLGPETLLGKMHRLCGSSEHDVSSRLLNHELNTEDKVLKPVNDILEKDIPTVMRLKKQLNKLTLDYDSIKNRYTSAKKQAESSGNLPAQQEKMEKLREDMEDAELRQEQCRDQFITELYNFMSKEVEYSKILVDLIESQKEYHRQCLEILERTIPQLTEEIEFFQDMPVYGCHLDDHLRRTNRDIALVLEVCVCALLDLGLDEEGLFRIAGSASKIKKLKSAFNAFVVNEDILAEFDIHSIAGVLKLYLREMPEPLMTFALYQEWMKAAHLPVDQRLQALWVVLDKLPKTNYNNLRYLIKFLARLAENQSENKMTPSNIAIVIGPNLIWPQGDVGPSVLTTSTQSSIVEALIMHADYFFPGDVDFQKTATGTSSEPHSGPSQGLRRPPPPPITPINHHPVGSSNPANHLNQASSAKKTSANKVPYRASTPGAYPTFTPPVKPARVTSSHESSPRAPRKAVRKLSEDFLSMAKRDSMPENSKLDKGIPSDRLSLSGHGAQTWKERPLTFSGHNNNSHFPTTKSSTDIRHNSCERENGLTSSRVSKGSLSSTEGDALSDCASEPGWAGRQVALPEEMKLSRAVTPPLKAPPPKSVHSDVYNTVFALQSLGSDGSDYLNRVRTLWDGHMGGGGGGVHAGFSEKPVTILECTTAPAVTPNSTPSSLSNANNVSMTSSCSIPGNLQGSSLEGANQKGAAKSEVDFYVTGSSTCTSEGIPLQEQPTSYGATSHGAVQQYSAVNYEPIIQTNIAQTAPDEPLITIDHVPHTMTQSPDCMTSSMNNLHLEGEASSVTSSPRAPRRKNKAAPPPPERPQGPAPLPPSSQYSVERDGSDSGDAGNLGSMLINIMDNKQSSLERHTALPSNVDKYGSLERPAVSEKPSITESRPRVPDRPPVIPVTPPQIPDRPGSPKLDRPPSPNKTKPTPDRPPSPTMKTKSIPDRPHLPPPSIPDRPPGASDKSAQPLTPEPYGSGFSTFKPPVPPPPSKSETPVSTASTTSSATGGPSQTPGPMHKRQGSGGGMRPPRPQPPPPPPPRPRDSNGSIKMDDIDGLPQSAENKEQTYL